MGILSKLQRTRISRKRSNKIVNSIFRKTKSRMKKQHKRLDRLTQYERKKTGYWIWKGGKKVIFLKKSFTRKLK